MPTYQQATIRESSWILILGMVIAIGPMAIDMYLPGLPALQDDFQTDAAGVQLSLASFFLGLALGQLIYGPLSDRFGRRPPLLVGLTLFTLASLGCALAPSLDALIALRFVQALGGCAGMVITRAMVRDRFPPQEMARILSLLVLVLGVAPILAPSLGSLVLSIFGWQAIFLILAGFGCLCLLLVGRWIPESLQSPTERIQLADVLQTYLRLLRHRRFMGYALSGGVAQAGLFAYIAGSAFVFIEVFGLSPTTYGWLFGINAAGLIAASQFNRRVLQRYPAQRVLKRALSVYCASSLLLLLVSMSGIGGLIGFILPLWLCISSLGFSFPNSTAAAMTPFGDRAGAASALLGTLQFGIAGVAATISGAWYNGSAVPMTAIIAL
ncbi:MAG: Bcr/CflA family multidrug efflux MFS transporter, partial [Nevskiales bacterium]